MNVFDTRDFVQVICVHVGEHVRFLAHYLRFLAYFLLTTSKQEGVTPLALYKGAL